MSQFTTKQSKSKACAYIPYALPYKDVINALSRGLCFEFTNRVVSKHVMLMSIIHIYPRINTTTTTRTNTRNRNFLKNKTKYTTRNKIFALACHQRRGLAENPNGDGNGNTPTRVCAWDPLTMVINQFPIMQLSETRVSNKNTRGHFTEPPHLPYRQLLISPYCR